MSNIVVFLKIINPIHIKNNNDFLIVENDHGVCYDESTMAGFCFL
jgi:hypothetical protein